MLSHSWAHVIIGMWHKYPNPHCSHVVTVDVVDRSVDPRTGIIRTERILGCKQRAPGWIVKVHPFTSIITYLALLMIPCHLSSLAAQKMRLCGKFRSLTHQHNQPQYHP